MKIIMNIIKAIIYLTIIVVVLFIIIVIMSDKSSLADTTMNQLALFYKKNRQYPKSLNELPIYSNPEFVTYSKNATYGFRYSTYDNDRVIYSLSWRDGFANWTEYSCTNAPSPSADQYEVIQTYSKPGEVVCTVRDLH